MAVALLVPAAARLMFACAEDSMAVTGEDGGVTTAPDAFVPADSSVAPGDASEDASVDAAEEADAGSTCSADGFCHTTMPSRDTFDAGDLAPDLTVSFDLVDVSVVPGGTAFAISSAGHLLEWRVGAWSVAYTAGATLSRVLAVTADDVWIAGYNGLVRHGTRSAGASFTFVDASLGGSWPILGMQAASPEEIWIYAGNVVYRRVPAEDGGGTWTASTLAMTVTGTNPTKTLSKMWRGPTGELWLGGLEYNSCFGTVCPYVSRPVLWKRTTGDAGPAFETVPFAFGTISYSGVIAGAERAGRPLLCIGQPCSSLMLVGDDGTTATEATGLTEGSIENAWASGPSDAWLVGTPGVVRHWNGSQWTVARVSITSAPVVKPLHAVHGVVDTSGAIDMWIVGKDTALHRTVKP